MRNSRRLDHTIESLGFSQGSADPLKIDNTEEKLSKEVLRELFRSEIDCLVADEIQKRENVLKQELQSKYNLRVSQMEKDLAASKNEIKKEKEDFEKLAVSLKKSFDDEISKETRQLDVILVELVMQCLMKIVSHADVYKDMVKANIQGNLDKKSSGLQATIKVNEKEYNFIKKHFSNSEWIQQIKIDERLDDGQMLLDDGLSSVYEIGFVNQLDILRSAFITTLCEQHVIQ